MSKPIETMGRDELIAELKALRVGSKLVKELADSWDKIASEIDAVYTGSNAISTPQGDAFRARARELRAALKGEPFRG